MGKGGGRRAVAPVGTTSRNDQQKRKSNETRTRDTHGLDHGGVWAVGMRADRRPDRFARHGDLTRRSVASAQPAEPLAEGVDRLPAPPPAWTRLTSSMRARSHAAARVSGLRGPGRGAASPEGSCPFGSGTTYSRVAPHLGRVSRGTRFVSSPKRHGGQRVLSQQVPAPSRLRHAPARDGGIPDDASDFDEPSSLSREGRRVLSRWAATPSTVVLRPWGTEPRQYNLGGEGK